MPMFTALFSGLSSSTVRRQVDRTVYSLKYVPLIQSEPCSKTSTCKDPLENEMGSSQGVIPNKII
jgi:hypothetical protein